MALSKEGFRAEIPMKERGQRYAECPGAAPDTALKGGVGGLGGAGCQAGVPGTPTYTAQNDLLLALIILNTCGFLKQKIFTPWGVQPQQPGLGAGWGRSRVRNFFSFYAYIFGFPMKF